MSAPVCARFLTDHRFTVIVGLFCIYRILVPSVHFDYFSAFLNVTLAPLNHCNSQQYLYFSGVFFIIVTPLKCCELSDVWILYKDLRSIRTHVYSSWFISLKPPVWMWEWDYSFDASNELIVASTLWKSTNLATIVAWLGNCRVTWRTSLHFETGGVRKVDNFWMQYLILRGFFFFFSF